MTLLVSCRGLICFSSFLFITQKVEIGLLLLPESNKLASSRGSKKCAMELEFSKFSFIKRLGILYVFHFLVPIVIY